LGGFVGIEEMPRIEIKHCRIEENYLSDCLDWADWDYYLEGDLKSAKRKKANTVIEG